MTEPILPAAKPVRLCRVEVPLPGGRHNVLFMPEDHTGPWASLGPDVRITPLDDEFGTREV